MLQGKKALISGGSRGIGKAIALHYAKEGADIALLYARNEEAAERVCQEAREFGVQAVCRACDVSDGTQVADGVAWAISQLGGMDILVNNAGITADALVPFMAEDDFDRVLDTNLKGAFLLIQQLYRVFLRNKAGRIINISSVSGLMGNAGQANYAAAKAGLIGLTKSVSREMAPRGITCNAIAPGFIETDMTEALGKEMQEGAVARIPMGRMGQAEDIAALATFLASEQAGYITGAVIPVDGGMSM